MLHTIYRYALLALSVLGSATLLFSCADTTTSPDYDLETLMTERSENRTIVMTENGKRSYSFTAPLIEGYSLAKNPYQEFRKGVKMTTFTSDSLSLEDATITANYAIYYDKQKLWEAKGNVVIVKKNRKGGDTVVTGLTEVYTQQLFWDARTKKIYSNVDTKVLQPDGWHFGVGFEADEDLKNIHFRKYKSEMEFDFSPVDEEELREEDEAKAKEETGGKQRPNSGRPTPRETGKSRGGVINPSMSAQPTQAAQQTQTPQTQQPQNRQRQNIGMQTQLSTSTDMPGLTPNVGGKPQPAGRGAEMGAVRPDKGGAKGGKPQSGTPAKR